MDRMPHSIRPPVERSLAIEVGDLLLPTWVTVPRAARAVVLFAQRGSGFSDEAIAKSLLGADFATVRTSLYTVPELERDPTVVDFDQQTRRLLHVLTWIERDPDLRLLPIGVFASDETVPAAIHAASHREFHGRALVCMNGRPDLAGPYVTSVGVPTALLVRRDVPSLVEVNQTCAREIPGRAEVALFDDPSEAPALAENWFEQTLASQ